MQTPRPTAQQRARLATFLDSGGAEALRDYLKTLRNTEFRAAGAVLGEGSFWKEASEAEFWRFFLVLATDNAKAYVGTMLKAAVTRHRRQPLTCVGDDFETFATKTASAIDRRKSLDALLPLFEEPGQVERLTTLFRMNGESERAQAGVLFRAGTPAAYFKLFLLLRKWEGDAATLRRFAVELIRKGDKTSFNLACMIREYFHLDDVPGTFSLQLPAYELSRLDARYETFRKILLR